ncbi:MAG: HlyD family efflux transporter periplasmic adaptor subunit [Dissulfurispiraceae bacterium]|jgi:multidrug resistance efflux pump|nr:HlyD family efflux transporter periplasmic adaptor subunit [Dissulfurispiraceae bacterium]
MKTKFTSFIILVILMLVAAGLSLLGPSIVQKETANHVNKQLRPAHITARGIVETENDVEISSRINELITKVRPKKGDNVSKGDILVEFDRSKILSRLSIAKASLAESKAELKELEAGTRAEDIEISMHRMKRAESIYDKAKTEYERQKRLLSNRATTIVDLDRAEERMRVAAEELNESRAALEKAKNGPRPEEIERARASVLRASAEIAHIGAQIRDYTIKSPIDGFVAEKFKESSENVGIGTPILVLIDTQNLRITAELEETNVGSVSVGQTVEVTTDTYKDKTYKGSVTKVFSAVKRKSQRLFDPASTFDINTQEIHINLDDFNGLKRGMTVTVKFLK